jgi:hypothetical protein
MWGDEDDARSNEFSVRQDHVGFCVPRPWNWSVNLKQHGNITRLYTFALATSFWLLVAALPVELLAWGISHQRWDVFHFILKNDVCFAMGSSDGYVYYEMTTVLRHVTGAGAPPPPPDPWVEYHHASGSPPMRGTFLLSPSRFPYWVLVIVTAVAAWGIKLWRRRKRTPFPGLCPMCSYDLRAHKPGDRCPECGTAVPADRSP